MLRACATHLSNYEASFVHRGRPPKEDQDTILMELSLIYCSQAGLPISHYDLPHSVNSRFIKFAAQAMRPFFARTEATPKALSRRWQQVKEHQRTGQGPENPDNEIS